jgi:hypothetical protein
MNDIVDILFNLDKRERDIIIENLDDVYISEMSVGLVGNKLTGAAIGTGVGAVGSFGTWALKRRELSKKLKKCDELSPEQAQECRAGVQKEIDELRRSALKYGTAATLAGAGLGAGFSHMDNQRRQAIEAKNAAEARLNDSNAPNTQISQNQSSQGDSVGAQPAPTSQQAASHDNQLGDTSAVSQQPTQEAKPQIPKSKEDMAREYIKKIRKIKGEITDISGRIAFKPSTRDIVNGSKLARELIKTLETITMDREMYAYFGYNGMNVDQEIAAAKKLRDSINRGAEVMYSGGR